MSSVDYAKPLAALLKDTIREAHENVVMSEGAKLLLTGGLTKEEYVRYLMMQWHLYDVLERALDRHASHPSLEPTYNPTLLARASSIAADISYLLQVDQLTWKAHPAHVQLMASTPKPLNDYIQRMEELSRLGDPSALLAYSYTMYLGILSGGQTIRHTLAKAYDLDEACGLGISFYAFKELRSSKWANQGEMKRIKDWFREGLDAAGEIGIEVKKLVVEEVIESFRLNSKIFETLLPKEEKNEPISKTLAAEKTYPFAQIVTIIAAVCLSHFILVIGGFTGDTGYFQLLGVEEWIASLWQPLSG